MYLRRKNILHHAPLYKASNTKYQIQKRLTAITSVQDFWQEKGLNAFKCRTEAFSSGQAFSSVPTSPYTAFGAPLFLLFNWSPGGRVSGKISLIPI